MSVPIYIDTNAYLDHFMGRSDRLRPLGEISFQLLQRVFACEFNIIITSLLVEEVAYNSCNSRIQELIKDLTPKGKIIRAMSSPEDEKRARMLCRERGTAFNDTLHAVLAQKMNAYCLVTRNIKDFTELQDLVPACLPELL